MNIDDLVGREFKLGNRHSSLLQVAQERSLTGLEEHQTSALGVGTRRTADTVDVVTRVIRRVELDDPVNSRDVKTTSCNVSTEQGALLGVGEFEEGVCSLLLLLFAMEVEYW